MKNKEHLLKITGAAVMTALCCVLTLAVRIPSPTKGYLNPGDCAVLLAGWMLGPVWGTLAGGVGSAFADLFAGYPVYIPGTLIIKAIMALSVALVRSGFQNKGKRLLRAGLTAGSVAAELFMIAGYWIYEAVVIGQGFAAASAGVAGNALQGAVGAAGACLLAEILERTGVMRNFEPSGASSERPPRRVNTQK